MNAHEICACKNLIKIRQSNPFLEQLGGTGRGRILDTADRRHLPGGGHLPHRYSRANGFDNPSVWCADILKVIAHIRHRLAELSDA